MTSLNRPARLNRALLATIGLVLLVAGGGAVAAHFSWLPTIDPDGRLVPGTAPPPTWTLVVTAGVAIVIGLLCLRWLIAQATRSPKPATWHWRHDTAPGRTTLSSAVAVEPLAAEVSAYPGVQRATATLTGSQDTPVLVLVVRAERDADLAVIRHRILQDGISRLRTALEVARLSVSVEFRITTKTAARAT